MKPTPGPFQLLNYQTPPPRSGSWTLIWIISLSAASLFLGAFLWLTASRTPSAVVISVAPKPRIAVPVPGVAPNIMLPSDDEATVAVAKTLDDLFAGKLDADPVLAPVAKKVKNFQSWSVTATTQDDHTSSHTFSGTLNSGLGDGIYTVKWQTITSDDNGKSEGSFAFGVNKDPGAQPTAVAAPTQSAKPTAAATAAAGTVQPTAVPAAGGAPATLPTTGEPTPNWAGYFMLGAMLLLVAGLALLRLRKRA